ncbi:MAG: dihydropteroate synthase [Planctomycetales bacterium]|nr:dihydropteroate synthase [Planctomycetales bacterium]
MGILNVTTDSFSDGGQFYDLKANPERAVEHGLKMVEDGVDILDVGGESTRPGSEPVALNEELRRVIPVIERLATRTTVPISVDTTKAEVARQAIAAGAVIVNDISGLTFDPAMIEVCAGCDIGVIVMHIQGTPRTMQIEPQYVDVVADISSFLAQRLEILERAGIARERIVIDPGVGFGKTAEHNLEILTHVGHFRRLGRPVLIGHSRKRFLKKILDRPLDERDAGTLGVSIALAMQGVDILRVHDVAATRDGLLAWRTVAGEVQG